MFADTNIMDVREAAANAGGRTIFRERRARVPRYMLPDSDRVWPDANEIAPLMAAARWAAAKVIIEGYAFDDLVGEALSRLTLSFTKIRNYECPDQLARKIARQHLQDLRRRADKREKPVTFIDDPRIQDGDDEPWNERSTSTKLELLSGRRHLYFSWTHARRVFDALHSALSRLDARSQVIVRASYGLNGDELSPVEIARILPGRRVSASRVAHLKSQAVAELRHLLSELHLTRTDLSSLSTRQNYFLFS